MEGTRIPTSDQLMAEMAWVRRLARALVRDDAVADDVVQDTWLVAAEKQPDADRPIRPWLARVVVNLVRTRRRGDARREVRQLAVGDEREVPTPAELVERVELQRAVAEELLALAEPYRSTVLLHFIEGYSSAEIARRLEIPDGTVRRRLKVALERLRDGLRKRADQPQRGWLAALVPLARLPGPTPAAAPVVGVIMKKVIAVVVLIMVLLAIVGGVMWLRRRDRADVAAANWTPILLGHGAAKAVGPAVATSIPPWLSPPGSSPRRIAGRVVFRGVPIAGAKVQLGLSVAGEPMPAFLMPDSMSSVLEPIAEVASAADGTFDFGMQPAGGFTVSAAAQGFAAASVSLATFTPDAKPDHLVLALGDCHTRLSGTIADASGGGIAKARIQAAGLAGTDSDASGKYSMCLSPRHGLGTPSAQVRVAADGYGTVREAVITVGDVHLDFKLVPEAVLVGRVVTSDGAPVEGARVVAGATPRAMRIASGWTTADRAGKFRIVGLAPGEFELRADAQGLATARSIAVVARPAASSREITVVVGAKESATRPEPTRSAKLRGRVTRNGVPVDGADVMYLGQPQTVQPGPPTVARTDASGSFVIEAVPPGPGRVNAWDNPSKAFSEWYPVALAANDDKFIDIELSRTGEVKGTVVGENNEPVAGVYVRMDDTGGTDDMCEAMTDATGQFDCAMLFGGKYRPSVAPQPGGRQSLAPAHGTTFDVIDVPPTGAITGITIAVKNDRVAIRGNVVDDVGSGVPDVYIEAVGGGPATMDPPSTMTDATGHFEIGELARGPYTLQVRAADGSETQVRAVVAGGDPVAVKLARSGALDGTLIGFTKPPEVYALPNAIGGKPVRAIVEGDRFSALGLSPGRYTIEATSPEVDAQSVEIRTGETVKVALRARATGTVAGTITELATQAPLAGLRCDATLAIPGQTLLLPPDPSYQAFTDAAGHYTVSAPLGRVRVFCFAPTGGPHSPAGGDVEVTRSGPAKLDGHSVTALPGPPSDAGFIIDALALPIAVAQVAPSGPAAAAGLRAGDVLVTIDGVSVDGLLPDGALFLVVNHRPGSVITLGITRAGVAQTIKITI